MQRTVTYRIARVVARPVLIGLAFTAAGIAIAACGSSPGASVANLSTTTTTPHSEGNTGASNGNTGVSNGGIANGGGGGSSTQGRSSQIGMGGVTVQLSQCMRTHGVPSFPDPNSQGQVQLNGVNPQSASFEAAQSACAKYEPNGGKPPSAAQQAAIVAQALKYSECMRSHGITAFPDPKVSSSGGRVAISISIRAGSGSNLDPNNPMFQAAQKACQSLAPGKAGPVTSGSATKK